jgi:hypothetical protein
MNAAAVEIGGNDKEITLKCKGEPNRYDSGNKKRDNEYYGLEAIAGNSI